MPELLELPPTAFTPDTGREAGLRSAELRHKQAQELENLRTLLASKPIEPPEQPKPVNQEANRQIDLANELVEHARAQLKAITADDYGFCETCKRHGADAKEQAALLRELRGLMEHLCRLHNIAQAPTCKATPAKARQAPMPEPRPVACGPAPTTGSVPQGQPTPSTPQV